MLFHSFYIVSCNNFALWY